MSNDTSELTDDEKLELAKTIQDVIEEARRAVRKHVENGAILRRMDGAIISKYGVCEPN